MKMILATDIYGGLGKDNDLLIHSPVDLKYFKERTKGKTVVMGANTWDSLPFKLPGRKSIVLADRDVCPLKDEFPDMMFADLDDMKEMIESLEAKGEEVYLIGGGSLYSLLVDYCTEVDLTIMEFNGEATVFFPLGKLMNSNDWDSNVIAEVYDEKAEINLRFLNFKRK